MHKLLTGDCKIITLLQIKTQIKKIGFYSPFKTKEDLPFRITLLSRLNLLFQLYKICLVSELFELLLLVQNFQTQTDDFAEYPQEEDF